MGIEDIDMKERWAKAAVQLHLWHAEGRSMPGYVKGNFRPYIAYLLGTLDSPINWRAQHDLDSLLVGHENLFDQIPGPHGWAVLQMLIARKGVKDDNES